MERCSSFLSALLFSEVNDKMAIDSESEKQLWDDFFNSKVNAFQDVLNSKIYIDKTGLLEYTNSVIDTTSKFICNSRPRRFGKSITADMMTAYYSRSLDTEEMFEKLNIGQAANQKIQDEYQTADS